MRILVIEDEPRLRDQLAIILSGRGYVVDATGAGVEGEFLGLETDFDLAVVDLGLPDRPGLEVVRNWRAAGRRFPVIILTARDHWSDKVAGLEVGADDYLAKPFVVEELLARIQAQIRRASGLPSNRLVAGPLCLDTAARILHRHGQPVELTAYEYNTLEYLMRRAGRTVSKTELTEHLYAQDHDRDSNTIEVFLGRLRRKLDPDGDLQPIVTLRGQGYRFELPVAPG